MLMVFNCLWAVDTSLLDDKYDKLMTDRKVNTIGLTSGINQFIKVGTFTVLVWRISIKARIKVLSIEVKIVGSKIGN